MNVPPPPPPPSSLPSSSSPPPSPSPAPRSPSVAPIVAVVLAGLFFVPLAPLAGAIVGVVVLARGARARARLLALIAAPVGLACFVLFQVVPLVWVLSFARVAVDDARLRGARQNVTLLATHVQRLLREHRAVPASDWSPPGRACDLPQGMFPGAEPVWDDPAWTALEFRVTKPHRFQYRIVRDGGDGAGGEAWLIEARGELRCDRRFSTLRARVTAALAPPAWLE
jgi:hypothetical protein